MRHMRIVEFDKYCQFCEHVHVLETNEPCNECLTYPVNEDTHRPINFIESEEAKNDKERWKKRN